MSESAKLFNGGKRSKQFIDLSGAVFGRILVVEFVGVNAARKTFWRCRCSCGVEKIVRGCLLKCGDVVSCGCHKNEVAKIRLTKHGLSRDSQHRRWLGMLDRCLKKTNPNYSNYGARGIKVCRRWMKFENFLKDMGPCQVGMSIERKDNDGDYCPSNCKWATAKEQGNNRRNSRFIMHGGKRMTVSEWGEHLGVKCALIFNRLNRGWSVERALTVRK